MHAQRDIIGTTNDTVRAECSRGWDLQIWPIPQKEHVYNFIHWFRWKLIIYGENISWFSLSCLTAALPQFCGCLCRCNNCLLLLTNSPLMTTWTLGLYAAFRAMMASSCKDPCYLLLDDFVSQMCCHLLNPKLLLMYWTMNVCMHYCKSLWTKALM